MQNIVTRLIVNPTRAGVAAACLFGASNALAAMVDPAIDDPTREWCYLTKSTTVIGVPWQPDVVQVTWDGALYTGSAELCLFYGNPPQPVMARQKTFLDGWIPIVQYDWQANGVGYAVEMFSAVIDGGDASNALQFVQVTATNQTAQPTTADLTAACRGSGQDYRFGSPAFSSAWTFGITNNALIRNGQWVYGFDDGAQSVEAVQGVPYTQPFVGTTYGVTARLETGVVTYHVPLQPGESKTLRFKMPRVPVPVSNTTLINSIEAADHDTYRANTVAFWENLLGNTCRISIPAEPRVENAHRACAVHVILSTRTRNGLQIQTDGLPYPDFFLSTVFDYEQLYNSFQLPGFIQNTFPKAIEQQQASGLFLDLALSNGRQLLSSHGQVLLALSSHILSTRDLDYAATIYPNIQKAVNFVGTQHNTYANGLLEPSIPYDNELINGCYTSHNLWALAAVRKAICVARLLGHEEDVTNWTAMHDSYQQAVLQAIGSSAEADGYVPTGLGSFTLASFGGDYDWENMMLAWPSEVLDPADPKVSGTVARVRKTRYHEGIMSYRNGMHEHQYITVNPVMQDVARGASREALMDMYHTLLHCGSTHEGFENMVPPWQNRMLSLSPFIPGPHSWGASKISGMIRNMFVMEYGGRQGLDIGQRNLVLFSVVSPAWAVPGQTISVTNAGTEFGPVSATMTFANNGAHVGLTHQFTSPPGKVIIRIPYFVTNVTYQTDATTSALVNNTLQLSPDATSVDFTWEMNPAVDQTVYQDILLAYRGETPFWPLSGGHLAAPAPAVGTLTTDEQQQSPLPLSFATVLQAFRHEYSVRYANFIAGGGTPDVIAAPAMVLAQSGTLLQYGFDSTSGIVLVPGAHPSGGDIHDDSGNGRDGFVLDGDGGSYTNDIPHSNALQNCTGIGSLNLASGSITTDPTCAQSGVGMVNWTDILRNGGLTMETWVKGGGGSGLVFTIAGAYNVYATATGIGCASGFNANHKVEAALDRTQWHHVAAEFANPSLIGGGQLVADLQLYVNGYLQGAYAGAVFNSDLQRGVSLGNHPLLNSLGINSPFTGLIYEPRVTLGALSPHQFTIILPPDITITQQPVNATAYANRSATFTVTATVAGGDSTDLLYQWQKNQEDIPGATSASYTTPPLVFGDTSQYRCVVSTADGAVTVTTETVQAEVLPAPQTVLQWAFPDRSGSVAVPIADTSGNGNPASNILYNGTLTYSIDIPSNTKSCTGIGSVDFTGSNAGIATAASVGVGSGQGIVTATDVCQAGGLTMEVWVRNPSSNSPGSPGAAVNLGGMYTLGINGGRIGFFRGDNSSDLSWSTSQFAAGEWNHLAVVMTTSDPAARAFTNISAYLNGILIHSAAHTFPWFLDRAVSVGNHQYGDWTDYEGLAYEPRVSLGTLAINEFTMVPGLRTSAAANGTSDGEATALPVTITNSSGTAYSVTGVAYSGTDAAAFSGTLTLPLVIPAGGSSGLVVDFTPSRGGGTYTATLTLTTDDPNHPTMVVTLTVVVAGADANLIRITATGLVSPTRMRIDFEGKPNTTYQVKSSADLQQQIFTGAVTVAVDGLTTNDTGGGRGMGFVEFDITVPGRMFYQIQQP